MITSEQRRDNIKHWRFQDKLMEQQGFSLVARKKASGMPRAYESRCGGWRISTTTSQHWKLETWSGRTLSVPSYPYAVKIWSALIVRYETPLALALWFNLITENGKPKQWWKS